MKILNITKVSHTTKGEAEALFRRVLANNNRHNIRPSYFIELKTQIKINDFIPGGALFTTVARGPWMYKSGWEYAPASKVGIFTLWERKGK